MNTNELIEHYSKELEKQRSFVLRFSPHGIAAVDFNNQIDRLESTLSLLSATIPRETAKCKPTDDDGDWEDCVLAYSEERESWESASVFWMNNNPALHPFWLPMPAAPEVTP